MADINPILLENSILKAQNIYLKGFLLDNLPPHVQIAGQLISTNEYIENVMRMMEDTATKLFNNSGESK